MTIIARNPIITLFSLDMDRVSELAMLVDGVANEKRPEFALVTETFRRRQIRLAVVLARDRVIYNDHLPARISGPVLDLREQGDRLH